MIIYECQLVTLCLTKVSNGAILKRDKMCFLYHCKQCLCRTDVRDWISNPTDTLSTEASSVLGILTAYRHRYLKAFSHVLPSLWYHINLILQYDYLKLVYGKMYYAYICYMMLFLQ